jgi:hypothetical protein
LGTVARLENDLTATVQTVTVPWLETVWAVQVATKSEEMVREVAMSEKTRLAAVTVTTPAMWDAREEAVPEEGVPPGEMAAWKERATPEQVEALEEDVASLEQVLAPEDGATAEEGAALEETLAPEVVTAEKALVAASMAAKLMAEGWARQDPPRQCTFWDRAKSAASGQPRCAVRP